MNLSFQLRVVGGTPSPVVQPEAPSRLHVPHSPACDGCRACCDCADLLPSTFQSNDNRFLWELIGGPPKTRNMSACLQDGRFFAENETWVVDSCTKCTCKVRWAHGLLVAAPGWRLPALCSPRRTWGVGKGATSNEARVAPWFCAQRAGEGAASVTRWLAAGPPHLCV